MSNAEKDPLSVLLTCKDMKKSLAFYRETIGFELEACWPDESNPMWANVCMGRQSVMLGATMAPEDAESMCGSDPEMAAHKKEMATEFRDHRAGVGVIVYVQVDDVDALHQRLGKKGVKAAAPRSQFYGIREMEVKDPDGYRMYFYTPIQMQQCQSCGMPMKDAAAGQMYCGYCTDEKGKLKSYEEVFEGTVQGYFMGMLKLPRAEAEQKAKEHLKKMPAWIMR